MITALLLSLVPCSYPDVVTLTAVLEEDGAPIDRSVSASFELWDASYSGTSLWSDATRTLTVDDGVIVVELGAAHPLPSHAFGRPMWLEIVVDGQRLSPRVRIASAPHALEASHAAEADHAETCSSLDGLAADDIVTHEDLGDIADLKGVRRVPVFQRAAGCGGGIGFEPSCMPLLCTDELHFTCDGVCANPFAPEPCVLFISGWLFGS